VGEELRYLLKDAAPAGLIFHSSYAPALAPVLETFSTIPVLLQVADEPGHALIPGTVDYEEAMASVPAVAPAVEPSGDDLYVLYTGGTTGMPKGVLWRQHDIYLAAMGGRSLGTWQEVASYQDAEANAIQGRGLKRLMLPPLMHGAAPWSSFMGISVGATVIFPTKPRRRDPEDVLVTVENEKVTVMAVVGDAMLRPLLDELERRHYDMSSVASLANGGAPLSAVLRDRLHRLLPQVIIVDAAGSSETGAQMLQASAGEAGAAGLFAPGPGTVVVSESFDRVLDCHCRVLRH
jgi:3-oxocholest-4-en-26-oate---CoA ligase